MSDTLYDYVTPAGVIVPDTATLQSDVESEWTGTFGTGLPLASSTPQGTMIAAEVAGRKSVVNNNAALANQINPAQAGGTFLDAIAALTGLTREPDISTLVEGVLLAGVQASPIPAGALVATPNGDQFALQAAITLDPVTGQALGTFAAVQPGPIAAPTGTWTIVTDVLGLETVTNSAVAVLGSLQQPDETFRVLRNNTLALQGVALNEAITSAVSNVPGVIGRQFLENFTGSSITVGGVTVIEHSIWVCVDGGTDLDAANALLTNKSMGCNWNGAQTVTIVAPTGQSYTVKFDRPTLVPLLVRVTGKQGSFVGDAVSAITKAVLDFATNQVPLLTGFVVGQSASPFEVASAIMQECPGLYISKVELTLASSVSYAPAEVPMNLNQKATVGSGAVTVVLS